MLRNLPDRYGLVARSFHWLTAVAVLSLIALGVYMTELSYYHEDRQWTYTWHRGVGVLVFGVAVLRLIWRHIDPPPPSPPSHSPLIRRLSQAGHWTLYLMLFAIPISGWIMSSADGDPVSVFGWFGVPAPFGKVDGLEEIAGTTHEIFAYGTAALLVGHVGMALKHQFIDRDGTLSRMAGRLRG